MPDRSPGKVRRTLGAIMILIGAGIGLISGLLHQRERLASPAATEPPGDPDAALIGLLAGGALLVLGVAVIAIGRRRRRAAPAPRDRRRKAAAAESTPRPWPEASTGDRKPVVRRRPR